MHNPTWKWLAICASLLFLGWLLATPSDALKVCEENHSRDTCIHNMR